MRKHINDERMRTRNGMRKQKSWKRYLRNLILVLAAACLLFCNGLVQFAMVRSGGPSAPASTAGGERVTVQSNDGLQLVG